MTEHQKKRKYDSNSQNEVRDIMKSEFREIKEQMEAIRKENKDLKNEMSDLKDFFTAQVEGLTKLIAEQNIALTQISKNMFTTPKYQGTFPIQSQAELDELEGMISEENKREMIATVQGLITSGGLVKNVERILSKNLILEYNVDGKQNKKRLQNYGKLMQVLYDANQKEGMTEKTFLDALRKGMKNVKNRHFKNVCIQKKILENTN